MLIVSTFSDQKFIQKLIIRLCQIFRSPESTESSYVTEKG